MNKKPKLKVDKAHDLVSYLEETDEQVETFEEQAKERIGKLRRKANRLKTVAKEYIPRLTTVSNQRKLKSGIEMDVENRFAMRFENLEKEVEQMRGGGGAESDSFKTAFDEMCEAEEAVEQAFLKRDKNTVVAKMVEESVKAAGIKEWDASGDFAQVLRETVEATLGLSGSLIAFEQGTAAQSMALQHACELRWRLDPHVFSAVENMVEYVIGCGITFKCPVPEVQAYLEKCWDFNDMEEGHKERFRWLYVRGEWLNLYEEPTESNMLLVNRIDGDYISEVETVKGKAVAFHVLVQGAAARTDEWYPTAFAEDLKRKGIESSKEVNEDGFIYQMKVGSDERGFPPLARILKIAKFYEEFLKSTVRLWVKQAEIILVEYRPKNQRNIRAAMSSTVKGGKKLIGIKDYIDYEFKAPVINSGSVDRVGRLLRLSFAAGSRTPEIILFYDAGEMVYAAVRESASPYHVGVMAWRDLYGSMMDKEARKVFIRHAIEKKLLKDEYEIVKYDETAVDAAFELLQDFSVRMHREPDKVNVDEFMEAVDATLGKPQKTKVKTEDVPIEWEYPEIQSTDPFKLAQSLKIYWEMGISEETLYLRAGFDPKVEIARKLKARQRELMLREQERALLTQGRPGEMPKFGEGDPDVEEAELLG